MTWRRKYFKIRFMDHKSVAPWSRVTQKLWASPVLLRGCMCGQTTGHTLSCRELDHKADFAIDTNVLKNLRLNWVAYQQYVLWISHFGTKLKIAGISSNYIIYLHIKALHRGRYNWEWSANVCDGYNQNPETNCFSSRCICNNSFWSSATAHFQWCLHLTFINFAIHFFKKLAIANCCT